jgi:hypothetical protein
MANRSALERNSPRLEKPDAHVFTIDELSVLREENKQLKELVVQLSKMVVRNVLDAR